MQSYLNRLSEFLDSKEKWTKRAFARNKDGVPVSPFSREAVCWCVEGAIVRCFKNSDVRIIVRATLRARITSKNIDHWNDKVTFEDVKRVLAGKGDVPLAD